MLGTKELLAEQAPQPIVKPAIKTVAKGPTIRWDMDVVAAALQLDRKIAGLMISDGRVTNPIVAMWLGSHGFNMLSDGKTGYVLESRKTKATYRLRIVVKKAAFAPSISRGAGRIAVTSQMATEMEKTCGIAVVFTADLPTAPVYFLSNAFLMQMKTDGILTGPGWTGYNEPLKEYILAELLLTKLDD